MYLVLSLAYMISDYITIKLAVQYSSQLAHDLFHDEILKRSSMCKV